MEFGIHESLGVYSGGLGILAGDHCKAASDLGIPLVGVGLMYRSGYFRQTVDADGFQQHIYPDYDFARLPVLPVEAPGGGVLTVPVDLPGRVVQAAVWKAQVGKVPVLMLDTDIPLNDPADRPITGVLYVRGREMRLCQEIVAARLTRTLGTLIAGGIPAVTALLMSAKAVGNLEFEAKLIDVERKALESLDKRLEDLPADADPETIQGAILLFDAANGCPLAIMDSAEVTALRTGALIVWTLNTPQPPRSKRCNLGWLAPIRG